MIMIIVAVSVCSRHCRTPGPRGTGGNNMLKVIDIGTNQKRVCDFLLVRHSNLGLILHRFREWDIAGFCAHDPIPITP